MFRTPNLHPFMVTWFVTASNLPEPLNNEEFLAERFLEDVMDGDQSIALIIEEVKLPPENVMDRQGPGDEVPVSFKVLTTEPQAKELIELGFKVRPLQPDQMTTVWDEPGMTWGELQLLIAQSISSGKMSAHAQAILTDDNDPNAPWYSATGFKQDDRGWFISLEDLT